MNQPRDRKGRFMKTKVRRYHNTMTALLWTTVGFLSGVIFEMFVQLITR